MSPSSASCCQGLEEALALIDVAGAMAVVVLLALTGCSNSDKSPTLDPTPRVDQALQSQWWTISRD
jgi:hypothetical protein